MILYLWDKVGNCGKLFSKLLTKLIKVANFLGEYDCKLDSKGRLKLPAGLIRQLPPEAQGSFVVNRGLENHLSLYPKNEWDKITEKIDSLNSFDEDVRYFRRYYYRGASEITLDSSSRILLPKKLLTWAEIAGEVVLFAHTNVVEIWNPDKYDNILSNEPKNFSQLAQKVMGSKKDDADDSLP